jgi:hypothetical protein
MEERPELSGSSRPSGGPADALDERKWQILTDGVSAAREGQLDFAQVATRRLASQVPFDSQISAYIWWLLRYKAVDIAGGRPTESDLHAIAERFGPRFRALVRDDGDLLEDTLLTVFSLGSGEREVTAARFLVAGMAALGVLMDDPAAEMLALRPDLSRWWERNLEKIQALRFLENRSRPERPQ